ncbi:serine-threonine protein kinase, putative [Entamoeba invadens IP1]|uniref:Serine-threonine protein kinase, putative n=1 Tax=Entamoeba invadens IP1 TaxID=370355 RepID=A0A0A1U9U7_ENTIV|nr:serine-threonine protein kinase, putative [Entamoeba invadens IP1]ELP88900.1 serine-threonine protein kinase, putative [Entamoeba invadens IP1]|eukprot:XP_004255671.1 serine-threonine protein kinase, putative [Entamoeba invadens IP1]
MEDRCEGCNNGFRLENGKCVNCADNCNICIENVTASGDPSKSICTQCAEGYIMKNGACKSLVELNCLEGDVFYGCFECLSGYFFNSDLDCEKCEEKCGECVNTKDTCLTCGEKYYFSRETNDCILVGDNCEISDQSGCLSCVDGTTVGTELDPGWYVPIGSQVCVNCDEECKLCSKESYRCTACISGYTLIKNESEDFYRCKKQSEHCMNSELGYCTQCQDGYFVKGDDIKDCIKCDESCATCKDITSCNTCNEDYFMPKYFQDNNIKMLCYPKAEINETCETNANGCGECHDGYYMNKEDLKEYKCSVCPKECLTCKFNNTDSSNYSVGNIVCTLCPTDKEYVNNGKCHLCSEIDNCISCAGEKCTKCSEGFSLTSDGLECYRTRWELIIPFVVIGVLILIVIVITFVVVILVRKRKSAKTENKEIRPFKVGNELEMLLMLADNEKFPLKTDKWVLNFGLVKEHAKVGQEYNEVVNLANMTDKTYYFEFHMTPSHRYEMEIYPLSGTLKPSTAVQITFRITMLCTASVYDHIGITAVDVEEDVKETAKFTMGFEAEVSTKLDHTELLPIMPAIGEGAFGIVFKGKYRGRDVAIKKMKARNLTIDQEKQFTHEINMLTQLRSMVVIEYVGAVFTEGEISIVTEYAEYGSLSKVWGKYPIDHQMKMKILNDFAVALAFIHENEFIHRDVKGENLLIFSMNPHTPISSKLTDFGTCRSISENALKIRALSQSIGTPTYMPPECLENNTNYGYPVDVYSFGIVLYETFIEGNAYENDDRFTQPWVIPQFVIEGNRLEKPREMEDYYWDLIEKCWKQKAEERPTFLDILDIMKTWDVDIERSYSVVMEMRKNQMKRNTGELNQFEEQSDIDNISLPSTTSSDYF